MIRACKKDRFRELGVLTVIGMVVGFRYFVALGMELRETLKADIDAMRGHPARGIYRLIDYVEHHVPKDAVILTFRKSEIGYYGKRKLLCHIDPRMVSIYRQSTAELVINALRLEGVDYILVPREDLAEIVNSHFAQIIADRKLTEVIFSFAGWELLLLIDRSEFVPGGADLLHEKVDAYG